MKLDIGELRDAVEGSGGQITMEGWMPIFIAEGLAALRQLREHPATGRFCHGDRMGLAGICLVPQIYNARRWGVDLASMPRIRAIDAAQTGLPAVRTAHRDLWRA